MTPARGAAVAALLATIARAVVAQPSVTIVAPAAPGGGWDQTARVMQQVLRETGLATQVQVLNTPGAAGTIGLARFVQSERGNPHALLVTGLVMVSGIAMNRSPVTLRDVEPLARLSGEYEVIVVPAASRHRTLGDLVAAFRANPRAVSWGGGSAGGTDEVLVRLLASRLGVRPADVNYIAYSGGGQALASVLGGHVTAAVSGWGEFASQIESGALRALAISAPLRVPGIAAPTFREQGIDLELLNWRGVVAAPGLTPSEKRSALERVRAMAASREWKAALARNGWADLYLDGRELEGFLREETARIGGVVAGARTERSGGGLAIILLACGALTLAGSVIASWPDRRTAAAAGDLGSLAWLAAGLVAGAALFETAGLIVAGPVMFALAARAFGSRRPVRDVVTGALISVAAYVLFAVALGVHLPAGLFG